MTNNAILNSAEHKDLRVITERSERYGDAVMYCMALPFEFRSLQTWYPILLQQDRSGEYFPVALFGFEQNENLFLDGQGGWKASYIPAMMRREPFLIGRSAKHRGADSKSSGVKSDDEELRVLSIDLDHPRVSKTEGEALFQPLGGNTEYLETQANLLENIYHGHEHCREFTQALNKHNLIETINFEITLKDGSTNNLVGFSGLKEEKVRTLQGDILADFQERGFLMPMFMMIASLSRMGRFIEIRNERLA